MLTLIDAAFSRPRTVLLVLLMLLIGGIYAFISIPKESEPDVPIPVIYVSITHAGISPEDAERLLIRPMEKELQSIEGLKELKATATEGHASISIEFDAGFNSKQALDDVREKVDQAKPNGRTCGAGSERGEIPGPFRAALWPGTGNPIDSAGP